MIQTGYRAITPRGAVMYTENFDNISRSDETFCTPCGRYSVTRANVSRYEVIGPDQKVIEWFCYPWDARWFAEGEAERNPVKATKRRG